ncbi:MAG: hypothetical protein ACFFAD_14350 [Candidatus Hermodarchaeota archaeon]
MAKTVNRATWPFPFLLGMVYLAGGFLWFISSIGIAVPIRVPSDPISSLMLIIISMVFLAGVKPLHRGEREGFAYIAVGIFLAGILFVLQLVILSTNSLGWILGFEDWVAWTPLLDITPTVWLFFIVLLIFGIARALEGETEGDFTQHLLGDD